MTAFEAYKPASPVASPPALSNANGRSLAPGKAERNHAPSVEDLSAFVGFGALLDSVRPSVPVGRTRESSERTAASQMFEASGMDAHQRRQQVLREDGRSSSKPSGLDAEKPSDVEARRAAQDGRITPTFQRNVGARFREGPLPGQTGRVGPDRHTPGPVGATDVRGSDLLTDRGEGHGRLHRVGGAAANTAIRMDAGIASFSNRPFGAVPPASTSVRPNAVALDASSGSRSLSPAQNFAALLGAARGGEVDGGRVSASTSTGGATTAGARSQDSPQRASPNTKPDSQQSTPRSGHGAARGLEPGRSLLDQLVRSIRLHGGARQSSARMQLDPPQLGRVRIDVRVDGEQVNIDVRTETEAARSLLSERAAHLTAALQQHGLAIERFDVTSELIDDRSGSALDDFGRSPQDSTAQSSGHSEHGVPDGEPSAATGASELWSPGTADPVGTEPAGTPRGAARGRIDIRI